MGKWFMGLLSEQETQQEDYNKFKRFWKKVWRAVTFQWLWNKNLKKKNHQQV